MRLETLSNDVSRSSFLRQPFTDLGKQTTRKNTTVRPGSEITVKSE